MKRLALLRAAGVLSWLLAVGFGPLCIPAMAGIARGDGVRMFLGFPTCGGAAFEQLGLPTSAPLLTGFLLVAVAEAMVGVLLWRAHGAGLTGADQPLSAASTTACASSWMRARCSGPWKLSA